MEVHSFELVHPFLTLMIGDYDGDKGLVIFQPEIVVKTFNSVPLRKIYFQHENMNTFAPEINKLQGARPIPLSV
jgi:hypothetical protein